MKKLNWLKRAFSTLLILGMLLSSAPTTLVQRLGQRAESNVVYALPFISASKTDLLLVDNDNDNAADPGDTIRYTTAITNSGSTNAVNVAFVDAVDTHTTLVPGSVKTTPIARDDGFYVLGNVGITVPASNGVLANDDNPDGTGPVSVVAFDAMSAQGGNVSVAPDGSFTYNPAPGFEGSDSFTYLIQDVEGSPDPAFAALIVTDVIWFIDNAAGAAGDGRLGSPFNTLAAYNSTAADQAGDIIFVHSGSGAYTGGIALLSGQMLIGEGASASIVTIAGITTPPFSNALPSTGGTKPAIQNSGGVGIALASGNLVRGLTVSNTSGTGLAGSSVNALTIQEVNVNNAAVNGIHLTNLSGTASFDNLSVIGSATRNVLIENNTGTAIVHVTNSTFNNAGSEVGLDFLGLGSANITFSVTDSSFADNNSVQLKALADDSSTIDATITGNDFDGNPAVSGNSGVDLAAVDGGTLTFDVIGTLANPQTFQPFRSHAINVFASGAGTASGKVISNTINGSAFGAGIRVVAQVTDFNGFDPSITIEIDGNDIDQIEGAGLAGIHIAALDGTSGLSGTATVDATVTDNIVRTTDTVYPPAGGADAAIQVYLNDLNVASAPQNRVCINATGNATEANGGAFGETDFFFGNDAIAGTNSGVAQMQGYATSVSNTWFNVNGNTTTTLPTPLALGQGPIGGGTCSPVAQSLPADNGALLARAEKAAPRAFSALAFLRPLASKGIQSLAATLRQINLGAARAQASETAAQWASNLATSLGTLATSLGTAPAYASGETINLSLGDLNPGQVVLILFDVTVDATVPYTQVCNQGLFTGSNFDSVLTDDLTELGLTNPTCTLSDPEADLSIAKTDTPDPVAAGGNLVYSLTVQNAGPGAAAGVVAVDTLPAGVIYVLNDCGANAAAGVVTWNLGALANSASAVCTIEVTAPGTAGPITNSASVTASNTDPNPGNNTASENTQVDSPLPAADLAIVKDDSQTSAVPGTAVAYTILVTNNGPNDVAGATVTDHFPASLAGVTWTCSASAGSSCTAAGAGNINGTVSLLDGGTLTYLATGNLDPSATGTLDNTASVTVPAGFSDPVPGNDSATDSDTLVPNADLSIAKSDSPDPVTVGGAVLYTITVSNNGPSDATNVVVTDNVVPLTGTTGCAEDPTGAPTCSLGVLPAGGSAQYTIESVLNSVGLITNNASVTSDAIDPDLSNNSASEDTTVNPLNVAPVANDDSYGTNEDTALVEATVGPLGDGVLANDTDADSDPLIAVLDTPTTHGVLMLSSDGSFTYTPTGDYCGADSFSYHANDGTVDSNIATVDIDVVCVNDAPVADNDSYSTNEDTALVEATVGLLGDGVLANDTDADSDPLTALLDTQPSNGVLVLNSDGSFTYTPTGDYCGADSFTYHANDGTADSNVATVTIDVVCVNDAPEIAANQAGVTVDEGSTATNTGTVSDADGDTVALSASVGTATNHNDGTWSWSFPATDGTAQSQAVTISGDDGNGGTSDTTFDLTVHNVAPSITAFLVPPAPVSLQDQPVQVTAVFTDPAGTLDAPYTCTINFGDGSAPQNGLIDDDECSGSHSYAVAGVYALSVAVTDKDSATGSDAYQYVVVYDPAGGFVTGGGWIDSPSGAYRPQPNLTGRASFNFNLKYRGRWPAPLGLAQFRFRAGGLRFRSRTHDWLIVDGHRATFQGRGKINGRGTYGYRITIIDAKKTPTTNVDLFRIRIWDRNDGDAIVYDNQVVCSDTADDADPCTPIRGGNNVIHKSK